MEHSNPSGADKFGKLISKLQYHRCVPILGIVQKPLPSGTKRREYSKRRGQ